MIPESIQAIVLGDQSEEDEREILEEWLEECDEDEFDEYLRLKGSEEEDELSRSTPPKVEYKYRKCNRIRGDEANC